jgi:hypothetical protein
MYITSLEKMESIVNKEKNLFWDGWTVVERIPNTKGMTSKFGILFKNKWHIEKRFEPTTEGWKLPGKYVNEKT